MLADLEPAEDNWIQREEEGESMMLWMDGKNDYMKIKKDQISFDTANY